MYIKKHRFLVIFIKTLSPQNNKQTYKKLPVPLYTTDPTNGV